MCQAARAHRTQPSPLTRELWFQGLAGLCLNCLCSGLSPKTLISPTIYMAAMTSKYPAVLCTYIFSLNGIQGRCYYCFMGQDTERESSFSRSICFQKGVLLFLGPICSVSIYLLLRHLDEVIPSTLCSRHSFPKRLVF